MKIKESKNYKIAEVVFANSEFNQDQVREQLQKKGISMSVEEVLDLLESFRDKGLIAKMGNSYCVNL